MISPYVLPGIATNKMLCSNIALKVAEYHKMTVDEIKARDRKRKVVEPRQLAICVMLSSRISTKDIGKFFGLDRTTVLSAKERIDALISTEPDFRDRYNKVKQYVTNN